MNMIGAGWILSAIWFIVEWPRPYSKGMWRKQWGWWFIVFLSVWLWACDDTRTITETEYVDRDVIVTEPYYTRTVYDENMGEFTPEQQAELTSKGYLNMRLFYKPQNGKLVWASTMDSADAINTPLVYMVGFTATIADLDYVAGQLGDCSRLSASVSKTQTIVFDGLQSDMPVGAISFWAQITGAPMAPNGAEISFTTKYAKIRLYKYGGTTYWESNGDSGTPGAGWHHFYVVWNSSSNNAKTYIDGVLENDAALSVNAATTPTLTFKTVGTFAMTAMVDAVQIFDGPIDLSGAMYNSGTGTEAIIYQ